MGPCPGAHRKGSPCSPLHGLPSGGCPVGRVGVWLFHTVPFQMCSLVDMHLSRLPEDTLSWQAGVCETGVCLPAQAKGPTSRTLGPTSSKSKCLSPGLWWYKAHATVVSLVLAEVLHLKSIPVYTGPCWFGGEGSLCPAARVHFSIQTLPPPIPRSIFRFFCSKSPDLPQPGFVPGCPERALGLPGHSTLWRSVALLVLWDYLVLQPPVSPSRRHRFAWPGLR